MQKTHAFGKKSTEKNSILFGYKFPQGNTDLTALKKKKTPTESKPCQEFSLPGGSVSMVFTSGMLTNYKMGLLCLTTDVLNDKVSVQEIKGYRVISTTHIHRESDMELRKGLLWFLAHLHSFFLFLDNC